MSVRDDSCFAQRTTFILNKKCDRHCPFCVQNEMKGMKDLSDDEIFSNFNKCIDYIEGLARIQVQIMGGEPTLWSDVLVWKIQQRLRDYDRYLVFTNGSNRDSLWYKDEKAYTLWHITDWEDIRVIKCAEREHPKIVVTHENIDRLEEFLTVNMKLNQRTGITISPCVEAGKLDATPEDIIRIAELQVKTGSLYKNMVLLADCIKKGGLDSWRKSCRQFETTWNVDCQTMTVWPCCGNRVKLDEFTLEDFHGQKQSDCGGCVYAL